MEQEKMSAQLDSLYQQKKELEEESYKISKKLYMKEFNLALLKGVAIIGTVIAILSLTLSLWFMLALKFAITAILLVLLFALVAYLYSGYMKKDRLAKADVRQRYSDVCKEIDQLTGRK